MPSEPVSAPKADILIIDDTPENLNLLSAMLTEERYKVRSVTKGSTGLRGAQASPPDLILLDVNMPHMNGYEVCQQLKSNPETCFIPVIFISALAEPLDKVKAFEVGGADYITKPFQVEEVLVRVSNQLTIRSLQEKLQRQNRELHEQNIRLQAEITERQRVEEALKFQSEQTEKLLLNILPAPIVQQLQQSKSAVADSFEDVSVLFADIVGFTEFSSKKNPTELVEILNVIFSRFDRLAEHHGLEKIKTIGDAYMVVGGLPIPCPDHAFALAQMALNMQAEMVNVNAQIGEAFKIRVGIHIGPVVAGVIGMTKFIYDLWGDTVNIASRMESNGIPGEIQVTDVTYERLKDQYVFEERGCILIKGKGEMTTYLLRGRKSQAAEITAK